MNQHLSPNYTHEKLENPQVEDLIDVFEDFWSGYIFSQCELLLKNPNGDVAVITLLCSYFEAVAGYMEGQDTNGRSKEAFITGFCKVFRSIGEGDIQRAAEDIYKHIRCGVAHEGLLRHKVLYSRDCVRSFIPTYQKNPGTEEFDLDAEVKSIAVNPILMYDSVYGHFKGYIKKLRDPKNIDLRKNFQTTVTRQWDLDGEKENIIGMTEDEFMGRTS